MNTAGADRAPPQPFEVDGSTYKVKCLGAGYDGIQGREKWELLLQVGVSWKREAHCYLELGATEAQAKERLAGV